MATSQEFPKQNLFSKMAQIMAELKRMKKGGKVDGYNGYAFATKDDVYDLLRTQMGEKGIALFASVVDVHQDDVVSSKGSKGLHTILKMEFTLACSDTGQTFTTHWVGESTDYGDKGVSQAASLGEKYFLLSTFLLSTGDDADQQGSVSGERQQRKQGTPQPATTGNGSQGKPSNVTDLPQQSPASGSTVEKFSEPTRRVYMKVDRNSNPFMTISGAMLRSREAFRALGYDDSVIEALGGNGHYDLPDTVTIAYVQDGNFKNVVRIRRDSTGEVVDEKGKPINQPAASGQ